MANDSSIAPQTAAPVDIAIVYADEDGKAFSALEKHLSVLQAARIVQLWHPMKLLAGDNREEKIRSFIEKADILVVLITPNLFSDPTLNRLLDAVLARVRSGYLRVVPVRLRSSTLPEEWSKLQALPHDGRPILELGNKTAAAWKSVAEAARTLALGIREERSPETDPGFDFVPQDMPTEPTDALIPFTFACTISASANDVYLMLRDHLPELSGSMRNISYISEEYRSTRRSGVIESGFSWQLRFSDLPDGLLQNLGQSVIEAIFSNLQHGIWDDRKRTIEWWFKNDYFVADGTHVVEQVDSKTSKFVVSGALRKIQGGRETPLFRRVTSSLVWVIVWRYRKYITDKIQENFSQLIAAVELRTAEAQPNSRNN